MLLSCLLLCVGLTLCPYEVAAPIEELSGVLIFRRSSPYMASGAGSCPQARVATRNSQIHEAVQRGNLAEVADVVQKDWGAVNEPGSQLVSTLGCDLGVSWIHVMIC